MIASFDKKPLLGALKLWVQATDRKGIHPWGGHALLRLTKDGLTLSATDLVVSVTATVPVLTINEQKGGTDYVACLEAKVLHDVVAALPGESVDIMPLSSSWSVASGKSRHKVVSVEGMTFPRLPEPPSKRKAWEVPAEVFARLITRTRASIGRDETRPFICVALLEVGKVWTSMTTIDGSRLSQATEKVGGPDIRAQIPARGLDEITRLLGARGEEDPLCYVVWDDRQDFLFVRRGTVLLAVKLQATEFVPYAKVIPQSRKVTILVRREDLRAAFSRVSLYALGGRGAVVTVTHGLVVVEAESTRGEGHEEVSYQGEPVEMPPLGLNVSYAIDALEHGDDEVEVGLEGPLDAVMLRSSGLVVVLMPIRLDNKKE